MPIRYIINKEFCLHETHLDQIFYRARHLYCTASAKLMKVLSANFNSHFEMGCAPQASLFPST